MLVLTCKPGEWIWISPGTWLSIKEIKQGKTVLVFDAPDDVKILREERYNSTIGKANEDQS